MAFTYEDKLLKHIDSLTTYNEKLEYLNDKMLSASNAHYELIIADMLAQLKQWGK